MVVTTPERPAVCIDLDQEYIRATVHGSPVAPVRRRPRSRGRRQQADQAARLDGVEPDPSTRLACARSCCRADGPPPRWATARGRTESHDPRTNSASGSQKFGKSHERESATATGAADCAGKLRRFGLRRGKQDQQVFPRRRCPRQFRPIISICGRRTLVLYPPHDRSGRPRPC